jgi:hypothetical protein
MEFTTNYSPTTMAFSLMAKDDLVQFRAWFMENLPYCIEELMQLVKTTPGYECWTPDYSPSSLDLLGEWFLAKAKKRSLTLEEIKMLKSGMANHVDIPLWDLTDETKTLAVYIGMYYGQVAIKCNSLLNWEQQLGSKKLADFGQPVVTGLGAVPINPVRIANSIACGLVDGTKTGSQLRKTYDFWSKLVIK